MDRNIVYPGALPQDTDILQPEVATMIALGSLMAAAFGSSTVADGLACTQTLVPSMSVTVAPGTVMTNLTIDSNSFGSLPARTTEPLIKAGINTLPTTMGPFTAPVTAGQSQNFLIQAQVSETDVTPVVLPYYNASNPLIPFSGPGNTGTAQNTQRIQRVTLQSKAGTPAATGSQVTPAPDAGFVGLFRITIANGAVTILNANIARLPTAPFIATKLGPAFFSGFGNLQVFTTSGTFTIPAGVTRVKATVTGAGGGGSNASGTIVAPGASLSSGGGGGAGGLAIGVFTVTPGQVVTVTVGAGGGPQATGGSSSFGAFCSATGGVGTQFQTATTSAGGAGGVGSGAAFNFSGAYGGDGQGGTYVLAGYGGSGPWGGGGRPYAGGSGPASFPANGQAPGAGGGGCYAAIAGTNVGGNGAPGAVVVEW